MSPLRRKLVFVNWLFFITETECLLRGTDWVFIYNSTFCPQSVFMCFVWIWEQTAIISLYSINWLVFITETECVYCAVRTGHLNVIWVICFIWIWEQTAIISLYSINWLVCITETECVYCAVRTECPIKQRKKLSVFYRRVLRFVSTKFRTPIEFEVLLVERNVLQCEELHVICVVYSYCCDKTEIF